MEHAEILSYLIHTINIIASNKKYGNHFVIKGGTAMMSRLIAINRTDLGRQTTDVDIHCDSKELWIEFSNNIEALLNCNNYGYVYTLLEKRSDKTGLNLSDSLKLELHDINRVNTIKFKIDMNIKSNSIISTEFMPILNMNVYDLNTQMSDKIVAVSNRTVFRRIKDLYDIAVLATLYKFSFTELNNSLNIKHSNSTLTNMVNMNNYNDLKHAYDKFDGIYNKPDFNVVFMTAVSFLEPFYGCRRGDLIWEPTCSRWMGV